MFAGIATRYDVANRLLSARQDVAWRRRTLARLQPGTKRILDLACGTFDLGLDALRGETVTQVHGCDFCLPMLQAGARKRSGQALTATTGDGLHLPYADGAFDAAVMAYGWRNFDDPARGLAEMVRVIRPGGQVVILEFLRPQTWWPKAFLATFGRVVMPLAGGVITGRADAYRYLPESIQRFVSLDEAQALFAQAGLEAIEVVTCFGGVSHGVIGRKPA